MGLTILVHFLNIGEYKNISKLGGQAHFCESTHRQLHGNLSCTTHTG